MSAWPAVWPASAPNHRSEAFQGVKEAVSDLLMEDLKERDLTGVDHASHLRLEAAVQAGVWDFMARMSPQTHTPLARPLAMGPPVFEWMIRGNHRDEEAELDR